MGSMRRRLRTLEESRAKSGRSLSREALRLLSNEDLEVLEEVTEAAVASGEGSFEDLYAVVGERGRRAMEAYFEALEAVKEGREPKEPPASRAPPKPPEGVLETLALLERVEAGDEGARREWGRSDGYRIWKYYKK